MKKLVLRRPSPALIVASVALIAALSGTSIALPGKNTVDSGDIKNNSVRGKDVNEGTLGAVPNAANAGKLGGQSASSFAQSSQLAALAQDDQILSLAGGMNVGDPPLVLDVWGPFTFTATCNQSSGVERGAIDISTSADNTFVNSQLASPQDDDDFDVAESPNILLEHVANTSNSTAQPPDIDFWDAEGEFTYLGISEGAPTDGVPLGVALNTEGADCRFFGFATGPDL